MFIIKFKCYINQSIAGNAFKCCRAFNISLKWVYDLFDSGVCFHGHALSSGLNVLRMPEREIWLRAAVYSGRHRLEKKTVLQLKLWDTLGHDMATQSYSYPSNSLTIELLLECVVWWVCGWMVQQGIQTLNFGAAELLLTVTLTTAEQNHVRLQRAAHLWNGCETIKSVRKCRLSAKHKICNLISLSVCQYLQLSNCIYDISILFYNNSVPSLISVPNTIARAPDTLTQCSNDCCRRL